MNNIEKITYIQNKIDIYNKEYVIYDVKTDLLNEIAGLLKELKKPQTLAEFLGWEEDSEYIYKDYKYKIINNTLHFTNTKNHWTKICDFDDFRQAKKVIFPKKYQLKLKQEYVDFFDTFGGKNLLSLYNDEEFMINDVDCEDDRWKIKFTEEEIKDIVLPKFLNLDMFDKVEVK